jgi:hypothetical protein
MQRQGGAAVLQPGEGAGVELDEGAHLRLRDAPHAGAPGATLPLSGLAEGPAEPAHGAAAEAQALDLLELLGGVAVVQSGVGGPQQRGRPGPERRAQPPGRRPAAQAVQQPGRPVRGVAALQALELTHAQVQGQGPLGIADLPGERRLEQPSPRHFLSAHRQCLPGRHGVTFLLNS